MHVLFQNPLWFLAALAGVPLLAHLFSRTRPHRREFPSLRLLREALRRVARVRRPRDRWLLLLRTLAMAALALAFLQPWLVSPFAARRGTAKTVVLIVDDTASMGFVDGTRTRLAQAAAAAEDVLATLPVGSKANIVWLQKHAASALPEPGPNLDFLRQALRQAVVRPEAGDIAGAIDLADRQLGGAGERELVVLSDFQKSAWNGVRWDVPNGVRLTRVAVGEGEAPNVGLAGLAVEPARPVAGQEARMVCRVRNFSPDPQRVSVFAEAGENRLSQTVEIAPWSEALALMPVKFPQEGMVPLKATLTEDRFPGDDVRYGLAEVRGALRAGIVGAPGDETARVWMRAAKALDAVSAQRVAVEKAADPGSFDVLLIAGWKGENAKALAAAAKRGVALVVQPAPGLDPGAVRTLLGLPAAATEPPLTAEERDAPGWRLQVAKEDHPIFALFADGSYGDPANAHFRRRLSKLPFGAGTALLAFEDGNPALSVTEGGEGAGTVAWWNLDLAATDWTLQTTFLPFFGEFLRHLAARGAVPASHAFEAGEPLRFDAGAALNPAEVTLLDEHDRPVPIAAESPRAPNRLVSVAEAVPGSYRWMSQGAILERAVVNFPEIESDLRRIEPKDLGDSAGAVIAGSGRARLTDLREGKPLWPWLLAAAALCFLLEGAVLLLFPAVGDKRHVEPVAA